MRLPSGWSIHVTLVSTLLIKLIGGTCRTVDKKICNFPFEVQGKTYNSCTDINDAGKFWCRTSLFTSESGAQKNWGYCEENCTVTDGGTLGDRGCSNGEICMGKISCPAYKNYKQNKQTWPKETRAAMLEKLKASVCKKNPDRLCCGLKENHVIQPTSTQKNDVLHSDSCTESKQNSPKYFLPQKGQCGLSCSGSKNVVFGKDALLGEYPWAALVGSYRSRKEWNDYSQKYENQSFSYYHCGGTLINTWFILTAAHCHSSQNKITQAVLGEWDVITDPDCTEGNKCDNPRVQRREVENVIVHHGYDKLRNINDIALVKMTRDIQLNKFVQLACLPLPEYDLPSFYHNPVGQTATVTGWGESGKSYDDFENQDVPLQVLYGVDTVRLQKGRIQIQPRENCNIAYKKTAVTTSHLCAGGGRSHTDSCRGDSGGGLMVDSGDHPGQSQGNVHVVVGVVSYGTRLCGDSPSVYTKVDQFIPWIKENLK